MLRRIRGPEAWTLAALGLLAVAGCAKKGLPSGGPPDLVRPRLVSASPDSGSVSVSRRTLVTLTFSEGMEPRSTLAAVGFIPPLEITTRRLARGRELTIGLRDSLKRDQTYQFVVDGSARDLHGNPLESGRTIVFTTAASFPPGRIEGRLDAVGFPAEGASLWAYREGRAPDSTARDFDAIGIADPDGTFRIAGLAAPERWSLWAFVDLNGNRSFEPDQDLLVRADTTFTLSAVDSVATGYVFHVVNPRAPGTVKGIVLDTLGVSEGALRVYAVSERDSTRKLLVEASSRRAVRTDAPARSVAPAGVP